MIFYLKLLFSIYPFIKEVYFKDKSLYQVFKESKLKVATILILILLLPLTASLSFALTRLSNNHQKLKIATEGYTEYKSKINDLNQQLRDVQFENNQLRLKNCVDIGTIVEPEKITKKENKSNIKHRPINKQKDITNRDALKDALDYSP